MAVPSQTDLNQFFTTAVNQFQEPILRRQLESFPATNLIERREFDPREGYIPMVVTSSAEMPTSYPTALDPVSASNGTGSAACDTTPATIKHGQIVRTYQLEKDAVQSTTLCLSDLQFSWGVPQEVYNLQNDMEQYISTRIGDWYRIKNIKMLDTKVSTLASGAIDQQDSSDANFVGLTLPTDSVEWDHLNYLYDKLIARGAGFYAPAFSGGRRTFSLVCGPQVKRYLFQEETKVRDTVNWQTGNAALENFKARGIDTAINGFVPIPDEFPIRIAADGTTFIYPFKNTNATYGRAWDLNPAYESISKGGSAKYEVLTVLSGKTWEFRPRPTTPTTFGMAAFNPVSYVGDIRWYNIQDNANNVLGNKGYYRADLQMAARPQFPQFGFSVITLIPGETA